MRASALGQAKNSCAYLLHKNLNCSSFSTGFTERALTPRKDSILADDPIFCPNLLFSLVPPPKLSKKHLSPFDFAPLSRKITLFLPGPAASPLCLTAAADTAQTVLPQVSRLTGQVYTGVTGRKERISLWSQWEIPCVDKDEFQG